ncbi:MAG: hypothetical protein IKM30_04575 [Oscillospiraceae bacterium]|nr:hypothetical protein [Oscillospiraceae bacterium]
MSTQIKERFGLSGNQLKIIALITMTCDHVCKQLLPQLSFLKILGRFAFPIFAYMIAQGCIHTKNKKRYLLTIAILALLCQIVFYFTMHSLYQCILVTLALSIAIIFSIERASQTPSLGNHLLALSMIAAAFFLSVMMPKLLPHTDYHIDYGIFGVLLAVAAYTDEKMHTKLLFFTIGLCLLAVSIGGKQWFSLCALPLLALYNGTRGKWKLKYLFYIYYPLHLVLIQAIRLLIT